MIYSDINTVPVTRVAIVFGAGLSDNGDQPSSILQDRIMTAVDLYKAGKVQKILMSGDNRTLDYNEPQVMINYAIAQGVSALDLQADYAGRRTYDTCYRAKYIFGIEKAVLITQDFHLPRALYTCNSLGIESIGYSADINQYQDQDLFAVRDFAATILAYWQLHVDPPNVVLGDRINF
jgi:vancomycin permeability regulator SanA